MGVLLIAMIATPQVMIRQNVDEMQSQPVERFETSAYVHDYFVDDTGSWYWFDAKTNGVNLNLTGMGVYAAVDLQFNFTFYAQPYDRVYVSNFGYISFVDPSPTYGGAPTFPSDMDDTEYTIAPFWAGTAGLDNIYVWNTALFTVIQFDSMYYYMGSEVGTYQAVIYPSGSIDFNYLEVLNVDEGTVGVNFGNGRHATTYPADSLLGAVNETIRFRYYLSGSELEVDLNGPSYATIGSDYFYSATVFNLGSENETNLQLVVYLDDVIINTTNIARLDAEEVVEVNNNFTITEVGVSELRATIEQVPGEFTYDNNEASFAFVKSIERKYAIFQDQNPWGYTATTDLLGIHGIPYDIFTSSDMGVADLTNYTRVIISSDQPLGFRQRMYDNMTWFEDYAAAGGIIEVHAADQSSSAWINGDLPGGTDYVRVPTEYVDVVAPWHQILNVPEFITDESLDDWNSAVHGYLENLTLGSQIILTTPSGQPVLTEFPFGEGHIILTTQTVEWGYNHGYSSILENILLYRPLVSDSELVAAISAPDYTEPSEGISIAIDVSNWGSDAESDIAVTVHANDELIYSHTIPSLENGTTFHADILWTPLFPGSYDLTVFAEIVPGEGVVENNAMTTIVVVRSTLGQLLWDEGHGCHGVDYYPEFVRQLEIVGWTTDVVSTPINSSILSEYSAFVISEPQVNYWSNETDAIQSYVMGGGGLFVMGDSYQAPLNNVTLFAGIEWVSAGEWGGSTDNVTAHPVTSGIDAMYLSSPVSWLNTTAPALDLIFLDNLATLSVAEIGSGRLVAIADDNSLDESISEDDNLQLGMNIISWLTEGRTFNSISNVAHVPTVVNSTAVVNVTCVVMDYRGVASVTLHYRVNGSAWQSVAMTLVSGDTYMGTIPAQPAGTEVEYYISATNVLSETAVDNNDGYLYGYTVASPTSPTTTPAGPGLDPTMILIIAGAGGVVVVVVILYLLKKKKS